MDTKSRVLLLWPTWSCSSIRLMHDARHWLFLRVKCGYKSEGSIIVANMELLVIVFSNMLDPLWKVIECLIDDRLNAIKFHDCLHGSAEAKLLLLQQLAYLRQTPLFGIFI
eukprot:scaffold832_cov256-Skeletonema_marinoi.AAC.5